MKVHLSNFFATAILLLASGINVSAQDTGESTFKQSCGSCHTIGRGRLVGPDLVNIHQRRPEDWILKFIKSSQSVIKSGDKYADSLFQAYNKVIMPDQPALKDDQVKNILSYIQTKSSEVVSSSADAAQQQADQQTGKKSDTLFSTINIFLFGVIFIMLLVIFSLAGINKNLLDQIRDYYSSDRSFF